MKRVYESLLCEYLAMFPCVAVLGPRQCGKTTLVHTLPEEWRHFDMENGADLTVLTQDPDLFFRLNHDRVVIDEAQVVSSVFPALRVAIDADRSRKGRFVITGSSSPALLHSISESLAGRVGIIEMSPLMWAEICVPAADGFMNRLIAGNCSIRDMIADLSARGDLLTAHDYWFRGGYPEPWIEDNARFTDRWMANYEQTYLYRDVARLFPGLDYTKFRVFLRMLAGLSGQVLNYAQVARDIGVSQPTVREYFEIADGTFLWRKLPPFHRNPTKRIVKHPKGHVRDSGLLHYLLRIPDLRALREHPVRGVSWEGMVIEEILRQMNAFGVTHESYFYRTSAGAEVDLVLDGNFGTVPFEIKYGQRVDVRALKPIKDFVTEYSCSYGVVINNDEAPRFYDDRIVGVPFTFL